MLSFLVCHYDIFKQNCLLKADKNLIPNFTLTFLLQILVEMTFSQANLTISSIDMNKLF